MPIQHLEPTYDVFEPERFGQDSPIRKVTRQIAFDGVWDQERAAKVAALFDGMSEGWTADHDLDGRYWPLTDALDRGGELSGQVVELGSGTGLGTRLLAERFDQVTAMDLSAGMLANAPAEYGSRVRGDSSMLPMADRSVGVLVLVNMFLFPSEVERCLTQDGALVWVNTMGAQTPIHLSAEDVVTALPGDWTSVASVAGYGTWSVTRRT